MFGTRELLIRSDSVIKCADNQDNCDEKSPHLYFLQRLYQQSKQISQIVAFIWRWADDSTDNEKHQTAVKLQEYFESPSETQDGDIIVDEKLRKLFRVKPDNGDNSSEEAKMLYIVFYSEQDPESQKSLIFPIFNKDELGEGKNKNIGYGFMVDVEHFHGQIEDPTKNAPDLLTFKIPYPPRPAMGSLTVTESELEEWVNDRNPDKYFAENIYIPSSSC